MFSKFCLSFVDNFRFVLVNVIGFVLLHKIAFESCQLHDPRVVYMLYSLTLVSWLIEIRKSFGFFSVRERSLKFCVWKPPCMTSNKSCMVGDWVAQTWHHVTEYSWTSPIQLCPCIMPAMLFVCFSIDWMSLWIKIFYMWLWENWQDCDYGWLNNEQEILYY